MVDRRRRDRRGHHRRPVRGHHRSGRVDRRVGSSRRREPQRHGHCQQRHGRPRGGRHRVLELLAETPDVTRALLRELAVGCGSPIATVRPARRRNPRRGSAAPRRPPARRRRSPRSVRPGTSRSLPAVCGAPTTRPRHLDQLTGAYLLTRYEDVHRLARGVDTQTVGDRPCGSDTRPRCQTGPRRRGGGVIPLMMLRLDGEDQGRLAVCSAMKFTPEGHRRVAAPAELVVDELHPNMGGPVIDVVDQFGGQYTDRIISEMLRMSKVTGRFDDAALKRSTLDLRPIGANLRSASIKASKAMVATGIIETKQAFPAESSPATSRPRSGEQLSRDGDPGDPPLRRRERPQPCRQRSGPPVRVPRSARSSAARPLPR